MLQWDCIILGHMSRSDLETLVFENEEGFYYPRTSIHNRSGDLGPRERDGIVSSLGTCPKVIQRPWSSRMKRYCIIPGHLSIMNPVTSVLKNVVGLHHPWTSS